MKWAGALRESGVDLRAGGRCGWSSAVWTGHPAGIDGLQGQAYNPGRRVECLTYEWNWLGVRVPPFMGKLRCCLAWVPRGVDSGRVDLWWGQVL